ncbi:UDP-glucose 4-epimerase GalE [Cellulomonas iranensis]|uniref:UDP-glucose 4-epimerase GalE n=1 Tax=Cellulomonas iranensis TaxID=76862 RepID=UPI0023F1ADE2|nr:UDP-glucose 4-epimerase GalE [Cellulomonas iranensis]
MSVAVVGGAGYIGAHVVDVLRARGEHVLVVDDLSTGDADRVPGLPLTRIDVTDPTQVAPLATAFRQHEVDAVVHLAARKRVDESVAHPTRYLRDNVAGLANVLDAATAADARTVVLSSTAAVYGTPSAAGAPVDESTPPRPENPYGTSKLACEWLLEAHARAHGVAATSLRYFNVAGAARPALADRGTSNLVPIVLDRLRADRAVEVFGGGLATRDGTPVRDYVHVVDVAEAHVVALDALRSGRDVPAVVNLGTGEGSTVLEVVRAVARVLGVEPRVDVVARRAGDPVSVVADVTLAGTALGWRARLRLEDIAADAVRCDAGLTPELTDSSR